MKHMIVKKKNYLHYILLFAAVVAMMMALEKTSTAKSLYLAAEHHLSLFDAWNINPDGTATKQATYNLQYATDPAGIAIDSDSETIFITSEASGGVEIVDPVTLTYLGVSSGPGNLAGIDVDDANDIVYAIRRDTDDLYIFQWDPIAKSLTETAQINLPGCVGAYGLALDDQREVLWVADTGAGGNWDQDTFEITGLTAPVDIDALSSDFFPLIGLMDGGGSIISWQGSFSSVTPDNGTVRFRILSFNGRSGTYQAAVWPTGTPRPASPQVSETEFNDSFGARESFNAATGRLLINGQIIGHTPPGDPIVRAYDINTWTEDTSKSFSPSHNPVGIAVDRRRNIVYTVSIVGGAVVPLGTGSTLLSKYNVASGTETTVDMTHGGVGVAVDEITGYVYITGGAWGGDNLTVWDAQTVPFLKLQDTGSIGNPAGLVIGNVSFNPLNLAKNDTIQGYGVHIGQTFTYEISYDNANNAFDVTNVTVVDTLPAELDYVSSTPNGVYDSTAHTVTWNLSDLPAGSAGDKILLEVRVNLLAVGATTLYNYCTIDSDQTPPTTEEGEDPDNPDPGEPGTYIIPCIPDARICEIEIDDDEIEAEVALPRDHSHRDVNDVRITSIGGEPVSISGEIDEDDDRCFEVEFNLPFEIDDDEAVEICLMMELSDGAVTCNACTTVVEDDDDDDNQEEDEDDD